MPKMSDYPSGGTYPPYSTQLTKLLSDACKVLGFDQSWSTNKAVHALVEKESGGRIGVPNYTMGNFLPAPYNIGNQLGQRPDLWASLWEKMKSGDPAYRGNGDSSGAPALGNPLAEAVGLLRTIKEAYGTPEILMYGGTKPDGSYWSGYNSSGDFSGY
ncbi:hypothetical protein M427DRAFT_50297 [Gonapodya prolifera JEL478]|uniref:Uncharacterized protein n=1 Tax=Gonapodya prolifera (strain JEL478) TaxID=1344416 RepID=A0A138ZWE1_GONPJ|nr:hypothetical protein M427DRAFT_50297 [Gonapodya prolifera JEL478]|eukprot:KXS08816.1 hypothetical protein M427DRAFT_50297 [Gonapodya prolifera JEL478]